MSKSQFTSSVILLLVAIALTANTRALSRWSGSYLLVSNVQGVQDRELRLLVATTPSLTYVRADNQVAQAIARGTVSEPHIFDSNGKEIAKGISEVESAASKIGAAKDASTLRLYSFALILGSLVGLALHRSLQRRPEVLLLVAACVSVAKARMVCSTCLPSSTIEGLDAAWIGAALYLLAAFGSIARPTHAKLISLAGTGCAILWQSGQLFADVPDCAMCQTILAINAAILASIVVAEPCIQSEPAASNLGFRRYAWLGCVAIPTFVISQPIADRAHETMVTSRLDYTGKPIDVLLPKVFVPKDGLLVMFGKATCAPCAEAHQALNRASPIPFLPVEVLRRDEVSQWRGKTIAYDLNKIDATPLFLIVGSDRKVIGMHRGWSGEAGWLVQFTRMVNDDLRPTDSGVQR